eukprot:91278-Rhodomonas_salina.1
MLLPLGSAVSGTDGSYAATGLCRAEQERRTAHAGIGSTPRNQIQEPAFSVQFVPGMRFLVFDFALYGPSVWWYQPTRMLCDVRY